MTNKHLSQFSDFITTRFGLHFPKKRWNDLARILASVASDFGFTDSEACVLWLASIQLTKDQHTALVGRITIGETYFFREKSSFDALQTEILPALVNCRRRGQKRLRIWSAGCSTGEEAYSIAILLHRMIADFDRWNITILATDVNTASLHKAARGKYREWSFRGSDHGLKEKYFTKDGEGNFELVPFIRKMVTFAPLNLAEDPFPSLTNNTNAMDIIFCRNVLMYFAPNIMKNVIEYFSHALLPGGWLIVSPCETAHTLYTQFETVSFKNAILYRKPDIGESATASSFINFADAEHTPLPPVDPVENIPAPFLSHPSVNPLLAPTTVPDSIPVSPYDEAVKLYQKGLYSEAQTILVESLMNGGDEVENHSPGKAATLLARLYANKGEFAKALEWTGKAIVSDKLEPEVHYLEAIIFQEQGDLESAVAALKRTLYLDHSFVLAHFALANILIQQAKVKEAAKYLQNAASLLPENGGDDILPGSEGLSARRLGNIIAARLASINV